MLPAKSHAFMSCFSRLNLFNRMVSEEGLGSGNNASAFLETYEDGSVRKIKMYGYGKDDFIASDVADANFAASVLKDVPGLKAARYKRTLATAIGFKASVEVDYFPGPTVKKKLGELTGSAKDEYYAQYAAAARKVILSFLKDKRVDRIVLSHNDRHRYPAIEIRSPEDLNGLPEAYVKLINEDDFTYEVLEKGFRKTRHHYYMKPDNFVHTPEGDFVMIDPF